MTCVRVAVSRSSSLLFLPSAKRFHSLPLAIFVSPSWAGSLVFLYSIISLSSMSSNRSRAGGLPSGPRSRSSRADEPSSYDREQRSSPFPTSRQVRSQKSMNSDQRDRSRSRSRPPPLSEARPSPRPIHNPSRSADSRISSKYRTDSETSGSSLFSRMRAGNGYGSSRTSLEDDDEASMSKRPPDHRGHSLRTTKSPREEDSFRDRTCYFCLTHSLWIDFIFLSHRIRS